MAETRLHLAQFNVARLATTLDVPEMAEFVSFLAPVTAFAERSPGFVWQLTAPEGQSSSYPPSPFADPRMITNLTVWTDLGSLRAFVYRTVHRYFLQSRRRWFDRVSGARVARRWLPAGQVPSLDEAMQKSPF